MNRNKVSKHYKKAKRQTSFFHSSQNTNPDILGECSVSPNLLANVTDSSFDFSDPDIDVSETDLGKNNLNYYSQSPVVEGSLEKRNFDTESQQPTVYSLESTPDVNPTFSSELSKWCLAHNITHIAINDLLKILKPRHPELPLDARTFLQTPRCRRESPFKLIEPGEYYHFGLKNCIIKLLTQFPKRRHLETIEILINIDGLPLSKSSSSQFYPILCSLYENRNIVDVIGLYHGYEKPKDCNLFLTDFVNEAIDLVQNGLIHEGRSHVIKIKGFICDAPAKSYIKYTKGHSGYMSCTKCESEGIYVNNGVCFPQIDNLHLRTDFDFRAKTQGDHHTGTSILELIPGVDMIKSFPLDYMHLICLGVVKKLIVSLWTDGKPPAKLPFKKLSDLSSHLLDQSHNIPLEFNRKPRRINEAKRWKASEFRQFLLYTGPVVLRNILPNDKYENFMSLHTAVTILSNSKFVEQYLDYANNLLHYFVKTFIMLYGRQYVSHNLHNLLHLTNDVKFFGTVNQFSAFPFENFMQTLKKSLRKQDRPLQQLVNRKREYDILFNSHTDQVKIFPYAAKPRFKEPLLSSVVLNTKILNEYDKIVFENFTLKCKEPDNYCCLKNGSIVSISNLILDENSELKIVGTEFLKKESFFLKPCDSSDLNIFILGSDKSPQQMYNLHDVAFKYVKLDFSDKFVVFPLLHVDGD